MNRKIQAPETWMGEPVSGAIDRVFEKSPAPQKQPVAQRSPMKTPSPARNINDPQNYLILEGRSHGKYSYPDLLVSTERIHQNKDMAQTWESLRKEDSFMLTIRQYVDFLNMIRVGEAYNGK